MQIFNKKIAAGPRQIQIDGDQFMIFKWLLFKAPLSAPTGVLADSTELGLFVDPLDNRLKLMKFGDQIVEIENIIDDLQDLSNVTITSVADGDVLEYDSVAGQWKNVPSASAGEANTGANVGATGASVFRDKTTLTLNFRKLKPASGSPITVTQNADDIDIGFTPASLSNIPNSSLNQITDKAKLPDDTFYATITTPAVDDIIHFDGLKWANTPLGAITGEPNAADNIGIGAEVFKTKVGIALELRRLRTLDNKIILSQNPNDIAFTVNESLFQGIPQTALNKILDKSKLPDDVFYSNISNPQVDDVLQYNGANWVNAPVSGGAGGAGDYESVTPSGTIFGYWFPTPTPPISGGSGELYASGILDGQLKDWLPGTPQIAGAFQLGDINGPCRKYTGLDSGNQIGIQTATKLFTRRYNADITFRFKIPTTDLDYRLYAGFHNDTSEAFSNDSELDGEIGFMLFKASNHTTYHIAYNDGSPIQDDIDTSVAVNNQDHEVRLVADELNNRWGWSLDGSALSFITLETPEQDDALAFYVAMQLADNVNRDLHIYYIKTRQTMIP